MRYLGGKAKLTKYLAPYLSGDHEFYEPFVGGFNIVPSLKLIHAPVCSDIHEGLIEMYKAIQAGWTPPDTLTADEYYNLQYQSSPLAVFASFGGSFGGKEWGGFARDSEWRGPRDLVAEASVALREKIPYIKRCQFKVSCFSKLDPEPGSVIYCDPPYYGTTSHVQYFPTKLFIDWGNYLADKGCKVYVSEFTNLCPERWRPIWQQERATSLTKNLTRRVEQLFRIKSNNEG